MGLMTKKVYRLSNGRYEYLKRLAQDIIKYYGFNKLPISIAEIIKYSDNILVYTYKELCKLTNLSRSELIKELNSADGAILKSNGTFLLVYNELMSKYRIRWTLAHEYAHYILNHLENYELYMIEENPIKDTNILSDVYGVMEAEANFLAKNLLVPFPILNQIVDKWKGVTINQISDIFHINYEPAEYIQNNIYNLRNWRINITDKILESRFSEEITSIVHRHYCTNCGKEFVGEINFCTICGKNNTVSHISYDFVDVYNKFLRRDMMKYEGITVDKDSRAIECPICKNEEVDFDGGFCIICGTHLINRCSHNGVNSYDECGILLPGNARFCHECGSKSTYYSDGLLADFEGIYEVKNDSNLDSVEGFYTIDSEDIPF